MRTREGLIALAAGLGATFAIHHILTGGRAAAPGGPAAAAAERGSPPGPAADAAPAPGEAPGRPGIPPRAATGPARAVPGAPCGPDAGTPRTAAGGWKDGQDGSPAHPCRKWNCPENWFTAPGDVPAALERLGRTARYGEFLALFHRLWGSRAFGDREATAWPVLADRDPDRLAAGLSAALEGATDPVARQGLIFHIAIALPPRLAFPRLRALGPGGGGGDAEDALCALAFRGDPDALREFLALATRPAPVDARRLVDDEGAHDDLASRGDRELLRAWRCIEALLGAPYFDRHGSEMLHRRGDARDYPGRTYFSWAPAVDREEEDRLAGTVLPAWLLRYEGHPGSDDMAYRLARIAAAGGDAAGALRWASRAATLPDQDMSRPAVELLVSAAEFSPLEGPVLATLPDPEDPFRNRNLLAYVRLRRLASERSWAEAVAEARRVAVAEPDLPLSRAFLARWAEPPPRGLDSGAAPLPGSDPLRRVEGERVEDTPRANPACTWRWSHRPLGPDGAPLEGEAREEARIRPRVEAVQLPSRRVAFQMRCWETLAELERRAAGTPGAGPRADLLYKTGAVLYHERDSLYPLYAMWAVNRSSRPNAFDLPWEGAEDRERAWLAANLPHARAAAVFEAVRDRYPGTAVADRAAYSAGLAHRQAAEDRPAHVYGDTWGWIRDFHVGACIEAFERCARDYPSSPLARDAAAAAAWWRRARGASGEAAEAE